MQGKIGGGGEIRPVQGIPSLSLSGFHRRCISNNNNNKMSFVLRFRPIRICTLVRLYSPEPAVALPAGKGKRMG